MLDVIQNIIKYGQAKERYPMASEIGHITIYKEKAFVYDGLKGDWVINNFEGYDDSEDETEYQPVMTLPSEDLLGLLKEFLEWKGERLGVLEMRRHYSNYFRGMRDIKHYRSILVQELSPSILFDVLDQIEERYSGEPIAAVS